uniref:hypothetical protein n=1 Tax=Massilia oculi TaxID=945844 RepID=UPI0036D2568E
MHHRNAGRPEHRPEQLAGRVRTAPTSTASSRRRTVRCWDGKVSDDVEYLSAIEENEYVIAQSERADRCQEHAHRAVRAVAGSRANRC